MVMSLTHAVPDRQLGLTEDEITLMRQHQRLVAANGGSSSSRAASRFSSQGLLMMDSSSLASLGRHLDRVMAHIQSQIAVLQQQMDLATAQMHDRAGNITEQADAQIARFTHIMAQLDDLDVEFDRIRNIGEITHEFRSRAEALERELDRTERANSARRDGQRSHGYGHSSHRSHAHSSSSRPCQ